MAPSRTLTVAPTDSESAVQLDSAQVLRASTALLRKIQSDAKTQTATAKPGLLDDADDEDIEDEIPVWLVLTTKRHIVDKKRLKPGKIVLPHPIIGTSDENLRICLITADPQRAYKDLIAHASFPLDLSKHIHRVIGITKLKAKYKSFESRRQLFGEYDVFLADDRVITYLPQLLGKVFYKSGSKRPIPVVLEGKRQNIDAQGNKRRKLAEGGTKAIKDESNPVDVAREIQRAIDSALVHLAPSTTTAVKVGKASMDPAHLHENVEAVVEGLVDKYVPQKWRNVRSIHVKGPNTAALPIWMAEELWTDEQDVLEEAPAAKETKKEKKRKRALIESAPVPDVIEVPGPDGVMRRLENPALKGRRGDADSAAKRSKKDVADSTNKDTAEQEEKAARKLALKQQKDAAKATAAIETSNSKVRKTRAKAADLI